MYDVFDVIGCTFDMIGRFPYCYDIYIYNPGPKLRNL